MKRISLKTIICGALPTLVGTGLAAITATYAAGGGDMAGMDMGGAAMPAAAASSGLPIAITLRPNPPTVGDNTLEIIVTDRATGKPVTGMQFKASVAMTSMDMGTTHPEVKEMGNGRYNTVANFSMAGPWHVSLSGQGREGKVSTALDLDAGGKKPWSQGRRGSSSAGSRARSSSTSSSSGGMAGMDMSKPGKAGMDMSKPGKAGMDMSKPGMAGMDMSKPGMAGMDMSKPGMAGMDMSKPGMAGMDMGSGGGSYAGGSSSMRMAAPMTSAPLLREKGVMTVTGHENWKARTGFGHNAPMVGMMDMMMVGGSGMEGMKMAPMDMSFGPANYTDTGADTKMPGMDMGSGKMPGMDMGNPASANGKESAGSALKVSATLPAPKVGDNKLEVMVMDRSGQPVSGAKISSSVGMTSMDMGTTHPALKEMGKGRYMGMVNFSMAGPWRVSLQVAAPGQKAQTQSFDFTPKG